MLDLGRGPVRILEGGGDDVLRLYLVRHAAVDDDRVVVHILIAEILFVEQAGSRCYFGIISTCPKY